jgi:hypothetical protein
MTHLERAMELSRVVMAPEVTSREWVVEQLWNAMVQASNCELERKRAAEAERDSALMGQSALLLRVALLQQHLDDLEVVLEPVFETFGIGTETAIDGFPHQGLERAKEILGLYEEGTVRA